MSFMDTSTIQQGAGVSDLTKISNDTSGLDEAGRAETLRGYRMYVRAILLESQTNDYYLHLDHNGQIRAKSYWDTTEDLDWSKSKMNDKIHALVYLVQSSHNHRPTRPLDLFATGLLLRLNIRPFKCHEAESRVPVWQHCGPFKGWPVS